MRPASPLVQDAGAGVFPKEKRVTSWLLKGIPPEKILDELWLYSLFKTLGWRFLSLTHMQGFVGLRSGIANSWGSTTRRLTITSQWCSMNVCYHWFSPVAMFESKQTRLLLKSEGAWKSELHTFHNTVTKKQIRMHSASVALLFQLATATTQLANAWTQATLTYFVIPSYRHTVTMKAVWRRQRTWLSQQQYI